MVLGDTFAATGVAMDKLLAGEHVTVEQYRAWATFCDHFKPAYDEAYRQWLSGDATLQERAAGVLALLSAELAVWTARTAAKPEAKGGGAL